MSFCRWRNSVRPSPRGPGPPVRTPRSEPRPTTPRSTERMGCSVTNQVSPTYPRSPELSSFSPTLDPYRVCRPFPTRVRTSDVRHSPPRSPPSGRQTGIRTTPRPSPSVTRHITPFSGRTSVAGENEEGEGENEKYDGDGSRYHWSRPTGQGRTPGGVVPDENSWVSRVKDQPSVPLVPYLLISYAGVPGTKSPSQTRLSSTRSGRGDQGGWERWGDLVRQLWCR